MRDDVLYITSEEQTWESTRNFNYALFFLLPSRFMIMIITLGMIGVLSWINGMSLFIWLSTSGVFLLFIIVSINILTKRLYNSNKAMQGIVEEYYFFEDYFSAKSEVREYQLKYSDFYKVIERKSKFYLLVSKQEGFIIEKGKCSDDMVLFIRSKLK